MSSQQPPHPLHPLLSDKLIKTAYEIAAYYQAFPNQTKSRDLETRLGYITKHYPDPLPQRLTSEESGRTRATSEPVELQYPEAWLHSLRTFQTALRHFLARTNNITAVKPEAAAAQTPEARQPWHNIPKGKVPTATNFQPTFGGKRSFFQAEPGFDPSSDVQPSVVSAGASPSTPDPIQGSFTSCRSPTVETQRSEDDDATSGELPLGPDSPFNPRKTIRPGQASPPRMADATTGPSGKQRAHTADTEEVQEMLFSPAQLQALQHIVQQAVQTSIASMNTPAARTRTPAVDTTAERTTPMTTISAAPTNGSHWRPADIGYFFPDMPYSWGYGDTIDKDDKTYYRSAYAFTNRLRVAARSRDVTKLCQNLDTCLRGEAAKWWNNEIDPIMQTGLIHSLNIEDWCKQIEKRVIRDDSGRLCQR
ncbi:uncharacterized protein Aud_005521 [Aspergillus udagawae]|uniref:Uncharacterized protein n=1 Tax=Aspergillus udagawae TaxID=91492 RepID=A0A8E0QTL2_9EURO|nr:uncharacterized protein Aud_005521 [Aspergillus udagawae]GIC89119.1 hypothetical protein Aud_005521 [Aspergillus udagawae]